MKLLDWFRRKRRPEEPASPVRPEGGREPSAARVLYAELSAEDYSRRPYERRDRGEGMAMVYQVIDGYWKPRYLVDERSREAFEFMSGWTVLKTIGFSDIDWDSLRGVPQKALDRAQSLDAQFPTSVDPYVDGMALVCWQLVPDGRYYMDEDGFGMGDDEEVSLCGYVDRRGRALTKFRVAEGSEAWQRLKDEARQNLQRVRGSQGR